MTKLKVQKTGVCAVGNWEGSRREFSIFPTQPGSGGLAVAWIRKFRHLGELGELEQQAFLRIIKAKERVSRGKDIISFATTSNHLTALLTGVACRYKMTEGGRRTIYTFQYPGDFCDFHRYVPPEVDDAVGALTDCSIGIVLHADIERITTQYPSLGVALWRDAMVEANIFRERLLNVSHQPALPRLANLLSEQLVRLEATGMQSARIPLSQIDLARAAGLSVVHVNRTIHELRQLGVLSKDRRIIEVIDRDRLFSMGKFDGNYLNPPVQSQWRFRPWISQDSRKDP